MNATDVEQRRNKIFEAIVETYLSTATPVGSELISRRLRQALSPATIRNIMVDLEGAGFLEQPHTSAGRVPTEHGYRFYVDTVMERHPLSQDQVRQLEALIEPGAMDVEAIMECASTILADVSREAGFVVVPTVRRSTVKQVELVPLGVRKLLCVLVANEEMIASHVVEVEEPMTREEAIALARFINMELSGLPFNELLASLERRLLGESDSFYHFVKRSLQILQDALSTEPNERLVLEGASYVVSQPEFTKDPRKAHALLQTLDAEEALLAQLEHDVTPEGVRVRIGRETQLPGLSECSYVTAPCMISNEVVGGVGVLGPKRMDYPYLCALVDAMARTVTKLLTRWEP